MPNVSAHASVSQGRICSDNGQSLKRLSADRPRCERRRFYMVTSVGLVSYVFADLGPHGELLTRQTSFLVQTLCAACEHRITKFRKPTFACHNLACKSLRNARLRATLCHFQTVGYASKRAQDKQKWDKMPDVIATGAHSVCNSQL